MLICSPQLGLNPFSGLGGGVYDYQILARLARQPGFDLEIITPRQLPYTPVENAQVEYVRVSKGRYANLAFSRALFNAHRKHPIDLLRVFSPRYAGLAAWLFHLGHPGVPIAVNHLHLDPDRLDHTLTWLCAQFADAFITISNFSKAQLVETCNVRPERIFIAYPGVNNSYGYNPTGRDWVAGTEFENRQLILYIGSLISRKNLSFLLSIFPDILKRSPTAVLLIGGSGEERSRLERQAYELGISEAVRFLGFLTEEDKLRWLNACDIFVSPSRLEGFGLNVAEAMASRKPVVVSNAGALPEVVENGVSGYVIPLDDRRGFVGAITALLQNPSRREEMGRAGEKRVRERFNWDRAAEGVGCVYRELAGHRTSR